MAVPISKLELSRTEREFCFLRRGRGKSWKSKEELERHAARREKLEGEEEAIARGAINGISGN